MESIRNIIFYGDTAIQFIKELNSPMQKKLKFVFDLICYTPRISKQFIKHIEGTKGLYEIRVEADGTIIRLFCCFDEGHLIVVFNGFQKKTNKTPLREIEKAVSLMNKYFAEKNP